MKIRIADLSDLAALTAIYNYEIKFGTATFDTVEKNENERLAWMSAHNRDHHPLLVAEENASILGYASLSPYGSKDAFATTAELSVYVHPNHRGQGVGKCLTKAIISHARSDGFLKLLISLITSGNDASIALHRSLGFTFRGSIPAIAYKFGKELGVEFYTLDLKPKLNT